MWFLNKLFSHNLQETPSKLRRSTCQNLYPYTLSVPIGHSPNVLLESLFEWPSIEWEAPGAGKHIVSTEPLSVFTRSEPSTAPFDKGAPGGLGPRTVPGNASLLLCNGQAARHGSTSEFCKRFYSVLPGGTQPSLGPALNLAPILWRKNSNELCLQADRAEEEKLKTVFPY